MQLRVSSEKNILNSSVKSCQVVWSDVKKTNECVSVSFLTYFGKSKRMRVRYNSALDYHVTEFSHTVNFCSKNHKTFVSFFSGNEREPIN